MSYREEIEKTYSPQLTWDEDIEYKGIKFYRVKMEDYYNFQMASVCLSYDQMEYADEVLAFKPRLYFLLEMGIRSLSNQLDFNHLETQLWFCFQALQALVFRDQKVGYYDPQNPERKVLVINGIVLGQKDFDYIRELIFVANGVEYDDEFMHHELKERIERDRAILNKQGSSEPETEDIIDSVFMYSEKTYEFIKKMSVRKFNRYVKRMVSFEDWKILRTASMSGMVTFKKEIKHWVSNYNKENKYEDILQKKEDLLNKFSKI